MDHTEKMTALKRAYADMILNMAKESAARVLVSERKAIQSQHSLSLTKEEAVAMLLRLKSITDSKIKEAEKANLGQVRKIQELEGRLIEAKDTIDHLRSELKMAKTELENKKNTKAKLLNEQSADGNAAYDKDNCQEGKPTSHSLLCSKEGSTNVPTSDSNCTALNQRTVVGHCCCTENAKQAEIAKDLTLSNKCAESHDLPSVILSSKEPELYRNGCTQRIRALEQNPLTGTEQPGQSAGQFSILKNETTVCENGKTERPNTGDLALAAKTVNQVVNHFETKEVTQQASSCENGQTLEFIRRLSSRKCGNRRKLIANHASCGTYHDKVYCERYDVDYLRTLSSRKRRTRHTLVKKSTSCSAPHGKAHHGSSDIDCSRIVGKNNLTKSCEILHSADSNALLKNSDLKDEKTCRSSGPAESGSDRLLKTFQRKRKRESPLSKNETVSIEKKNASKMGGKQKASLEPQKSSLVMESSRDRRVAQVARQLIALSGKRW